MKKIKLLGMIISVMFLWLWGQPLEAYAKEYLWTTQNDVTGWHKMEDGTLVAIDNAPEELTDEDRISIQAKPDETCKTWLSNLDQTVSMISISVSDKDENIVIGKVGGKFSTYLNVFNGNVTVNGDMAVVYAHQNSILTVNGSTNMLNLGTYSENCDPATSIVTVNGNVSCVTWIREREEIDVNYNSFMGNCTISGTVMSGSIVELYYDDVMKKNVFAKVGDIGKCTAGSFVITEGVLSDEVPVVEKEPSIGEYYHLYSCDFDTWYKGYYSKDSYQFATSERCEIEDIPNMAQVVVSKATTPIVLDIDLGFLQVNEGNVTVNGDIVSGEPGVSAQGYFTMTPSYSGEYTVVINGNVENLNAIYKYNSNANVTITGKVSYGEYRTGLASEMRFFECENVQLIKDGVWNENVLLYTSLNDDALSYEVVDEKTVADALGDETIGQEVVDGETTIVKSVEAALKQTTQEVIDSIAETDDFKGVLDTIIEKMEETVEEVLDAKAICAVDISIDSFYREKETGNVYTANPTYGKENISELPEGNTLEFTVKVPKAHYKENAKYTIVRQHENADGSVLLEQLETMQNGDMLTFASDKFSTFVIVEVAEKKDTAITISNADGLIVKQDGIFGSNGSFSLSGLVAGIYTLNVTRENYVPRTYTVEVETDLETVELDVELHKTGDITGDDTINARDKKMLYNHIAGTATLEDYDFAVGDVTGDGSLNARDKKMIYNHIAGTSSLWE